MVAFGCHMPLNILTLPLSPSLILAYGHEDQQSVNEEGKQIGGRSVSSKRPKWYVIEPFSLSMIV